MLFSAFVMLEWKASRLKLIRLLGKLRYTADSKIPGLGHLGDGLMDGRTILGPLMFVKHWRKCS